MMSTQTETPSESTDPATLEEKRPWALKALPPFPAVALQLLSLLDDSEAPMKKIVDLLRIDPALSAEILRVSNSALYGLSRKIDNVSHAIVGLVAAAPPIAAPRRTAPPGLPPMPKVARPESSVRMH